MAFVDVNQPRSVQENYDVLVKARVVGVILEKQSLQVVPENRFAHFKPFQHKNVFLKFGTKRAIYKTLLLWKNVFFAEWSRLVV